MRTVVLTLCGLVFLGCAGKRRSDVKAPYSAINGVAIIAHRGGSLEAPENTLEAAQNAIDAGVDWVEVDVVLSRDGVPMVVHEDDLARSARAEGRVSNLDSSEIKRIRVGNPGWNESALEALGREGITPTDFGARFSNARIPSLDELLGLGVRVMIEMKSTEEPQALADAVLESVKNSFAYDRVAFASSDPRLLKAVELRDPTLPLIGILDNLESLESLLRFELKAVAVRVDLTEAVLQRAPSDVAVWVWTIYSDEMAHLAVRAGVDGVITDVPQATVRALRPQPELYLKRWEPETVLGPERAF